MFDQMEARFAGGSMRRFVLFYKNLYKRKESSAQPEANTPFG
jgi:hypothetical protein